MGWEEKNISKETIIQRELFPDLSEEENCIIDILQKAEDGMQINTLVVKSNMPINRISAILFEMEMKGIVRTLAGGIYRLIQ